MKWGFGEKSVCVQSLVGGFPGFDNLLLLQKIFGKPCYLLNLSPLRVVFHTCRETSISFLTSHWWSPMIKEILVLGCFITAEEEGQKFIVCLRRVLSKKENLSGLLLIEFLLFKTSQIQQTANYVSTFVRRGLENPIKCIKANGQSKVFFDKFDNVLAGGKNSPRLSRWMSTGQCPGVLANNLVQPWDFGPWQPFWQNFSISTIFFY